MTSCGEGSYGRLGHGSSDRESEMRTVNSLQGASYCLLLREFLFNIVMYFSRTCTVTSVLHYTYVIMCTFVIILYSGGLSREVNFANFTGPGTGQFTNF